jgi:hypothetical protein
MKTTITTRKGSISFPTELVPRILGKRAHSPASLKTLPYVKPNYKGKNSAGGRKCIFSQSTAYKNGYTPTATPWPRK